MKIDVFTLFPEVMVPYLLASILGKAQEAGLSDIRLHNIRDHATDRHSMTDDEPYGGGGGMVMKPEPLFEAVESVLGNELGETRIVLLTSAGPSIYARNCSGTGWFEQGSADIGTV